MNERRSANGLRSLAVLFALAACAAAQELTPAQPPVVSRATVHGSYLVSPGAILSRLGLRAGQVLDEAGLQARVQDVNASGLLGHVSTQIVRLDERSVEVHVQLEERVGVAKIQFKGNAHLSDERLLKAAGIEPGETVDPGLAKAAQKRIAEAYEAAGCFLASVKAYVSFARDGEPVLVFDIAEGPVAWIESIGFRGNAAFSSQDLGGRMKSRVRKWPPFLWPGRFDESVFHDDLARIEEAYYSAGFLDATVSGYWTYTDDLRKLTLHVLVYEGVLYKAKRIGFAGNTIFRDSELLDAIPVREGQPVRPPDIEKAKEIIAEMYGRQGYVDVGAPGKDTLREQLVFSEQEPTVEVWFHITEGEPVFVRRIRVEGLTKTSEIVVLRHVTFHPGDRVNADELKASEEALRGTGYFDMTDPRPVEVFVEPGEGALRDAVVKVKEGPTGAVFFGLGLSSDAGVLGEITIREENFDISNWPSSWRDLAQGGALRGGGQKLLAQLSLGSERRSFLLSFTDPAVGNTAYSAGGKLYSSMVGWEDFDITRTGVGASFGRQLGRHATGRVEVGFERISMDNLDSGVPPEIGQDEGSYNKGYVSATYTLDKRDNPLLPSRGYLTSVTAEAAFLDVETVKLIAEAEKHWTLLEQEGGRKHIASVRGKAGIMDSYSGARIPVFERFYAGGIGSLRGFEPWGVSPVEPVKGRQVGGQSMLVGSAEYSVPIIRNDLRFAAFLDAGYVKEDPWDVFSGWDELRVSPGVGLRWVIPVLGGMPLSLDFAFPVMKEHEDKTRAVHFSLGAGHWF